MHILMTWIVDGKLSPFYTGKSSPRGLQNTYKGIEIAFDKLSSSFTVEPAVCFYREPRHSVEPIPETVTLHYLCNETEAVCKSVNVCSEHSILHLRMLDILQSSDTDTLETLISGEVHNNIDAESLRSTLSLSPPPIEIMLPSSFDIPSFETALNFVDTYYNPAKQQRPRKKHKPNCALQAIKNPCLLDTLGFKNNCTFGDTAITASNFIKSSDCELVDIKIHDDNKKYSTTFEATAAHILRHHPDFFLCQARVTFCNWKKTASSFYLSAMNSSGLQQKQYKATLFEFVAFGIKPNGLPALA